MKAVCDSTERFVDRISTDQYDLSTPCSQWQVRQLANHLLATFENGTALLQDRMPSVQAGPGQVPAEDLIGPDLIGAYRAGAAALVAATTDDAVRSAHVTPFGEMPGMGLAFFAALDVLVHGWDLAKATGQDATLDPALAEPLLTMAEQMISDEMGTRAPLIGPQVAVGADADATARLVAFMGRQP